MTVAVLLTSPEVCEVTGLTYRQIDYLVRSGIPLPIVERQSGSGSRRLFPPQSVEALCVVSRFSTSPLVSHMTTSLASAIVTAVLSGRNAVDIGDGMTLTWTNP